MGLDQAKEFVKGLISRYEGIIRVPLSIYAGIKTSLVVTEEVGVVEDMGKGTVSAS
jgi:hypothetical protein